MGVILGVAVLLDAFLVRLLLVPVLLRLVGPAAWYLPHWLGRLLPAVHFGHAGAGGGPTGRATKPAEPIVVRS
jgi:RND superfamily putative drug exporter